MVNTADALRRWKCEEPDCGKAYSRRDYLMHHVRSFHEGLRDWKCSVCGNEFTTKQSMALHEKKVHRVKKGHDWKCAAPGCNQEFDREAQLAKHNESFCRVPAKHGEKRRRADAPSAERPRKDAAAGPVKDKPFRTSVLVPGTDVRDSDSGSNSEDFFRVVRVVDAARGEDGRFDLEEVLHRLSAGGKDGDSVREPLSVPEMRSELLEMAAQGMITPEQMLVSEESEGSEG